MSWLLLVYIKCNFTPMDSSIAGYLYRRKLMTSFLSRFFGPPLPSLSAKDLFEKTKGSKRPLILDVREAVEYRAWNPTVTV